MEFTNVGVSGYESEEQTLNKVITVFVTNVVFQSVGLSWIIGSKDQLKFDFKHHCPNCILNIPRYNTPICSHLHGSSFEDCFTTAQKDSYNLMCFVEYIKHVLTLQIVVVADRYYMYQQRMRQYHLIMQ